QWLRRLESAENQAKFLGSWELAGGWERGIAYQDALLGADRAALTAVANRYLTLDNASLVAYRPRAVAPLGVDASTVRSMLEAPGIARLEPSAPPTPAGAPAARAARHERVVDGVHVFRSAAGLPILVKPRPGAALAHIGAFIA